jgi:copper chaperone CopZ
VKLSTLLLAVAGVVLAYVALNSDSRTGPTLEAGLDPTLPIPSELSGTLPEGHVALVFDVDGMCCKGCPRGLYEKVVGVDGVVEAAASFDTGTVSAVVPEDFAPEEVLAVLESDKYSARLR